MRSISGRNLSQIVVKVALITIIGLLAGCGSKPFVYESQNEIPSGPGMFSGEEGGYVIKADVDSLFKKQESKADGTDSVVNKPDDGSSENDLKLYQEYQQYKRWKASQKDDTEFQEFLEWQKWKALKKQSKED